MSPWFEKQVRKTLNLYEKRKKISQGTVHLMSQLFSSVRAKK